MHFFFIFFSKNLHMSKNCCTFAPDLKTYISTIIFITILTIKNSQL